MKASRPPAEAPTPTTGNSARRRAPAAVVGSVGWRLLATRFVRWTVLFINDSSPSIARTDSDTAQPQKRAEKYHEGHAAPSASANRPS